MVRVPAEALVPLETKRRLLTDVAAAHDLLPLLRVGRVIPQLAAHPVLTALRAARDPLDLFARWGRLKRFGHSHHRVVLRHTALRRLVAEHAWPAGSPPHAAEDALILGVLTALLRDIGVRDRTVALDGDVVVHAGGVFTAPPPDHPTARWQFTWSAYRPAPHPDAGPGDPATRARGLLLGDLARRWTLGDLAAEHGVSPRTCNANCAAPAASPPCSAPCASSVPRTCSSPVPTR